MYDFFVSHLFQDREWAVELMNHLAKDGKRVFLLQEPLSGDDLNLRVLEALKDSKAFVVVMTPEAMDSAWITAEVSAAIALGLRLFVVRDASTPPDSLPMFIADRPQIPMAAPDQVAASILVAASD